MNRLDLKLATLAWLQRWFPERQIVLRQGDRISALTLSTRGQTLIAAFLLGLALTSLLASGAFLWQRRQAALAQNAAAGARQAYAQLLDEVSGQHGKMRGLVAELERSRGELLALLERRETGRGPQTDQLDGWLRRLGRDITGLTHRADGLNADVAELRGKLDASEDEQTRFAAAREAIEQRIAGLESQLTEEQRRAGDLQRALTAKIAAADRAERERRAAEAEKAAAASRAAQAESQLASAQKQHDEAYDALNRRAKNSIAVVERLVGAAGVDPARAVPPIAAAPSPAPSQTSTLAVPSPETQPSAGAPPTNGADSASRDSVVRRRAGGPFVPWRGELGQGAAGRDRPAPDAKPLDPRAAETAAMLLRLERLTALVGTLPIASPVRSISLSSRFGYRRDPFNGRPALHEGVDLLGPSGAPVLAAASGVVIAAGWMHAYGWTVDIDHGRGLRTRYAHLRQMLVTVGQEVRQRDQIGEMGATGRAQTTHLHFEIRADGRPVDPVTYLKVLNPHVFKD